MRNPFSVEDVLDPTGPDVEDFVKSVRPPADPATDENALAWVTVATEADGLEGAWTSRWRTKRGDWRQGVATLRLDGNRVYILYKDAETYIIEAERRGEQLIGRYVNLGASGETSPFFGIIRDNYRIDGFWREGRWDLRRCSPDEQPEPIIAALVTEARKLGAAELRELLGFARYLRWRVDGDR